MKKEMTKSLPVSKRMVYNSYLKVCAKNGSAGIDNESIEMFNANLSYNLYKIWNRITSGSYFLKIIFFVSQTALLLSGIRCVALLYIL